MAQESGAGIWDEVYTHACIQSVIFQQMSTKSLDLKACGSVTLEGVPTRRMTRLVQSCLGGRLSVKRDKLKKKSVSPPYTLQQNHNASKIHRERPAIQEWTLLV